MLKHLIIILCLALSTGLKSQTAEEALHHLEDLTSSLDGFRISTWNVLKTMVHNKSSAELDWQIQSLAEKIETERKRVATTDGFYGDLTAKVAMTVFLRNSHNILTDDFRAIRKLERKSSESFEDMEKYLIAQNTANERLSEAGERFDDEVKRFAERYKIQVNEEKSDLSKSIELASLALGYYNQVFLSYFKVYHQKLAVYEALRSEDLERISEEIELFDFYAKEGSQRLLILGGFMEDEALSVAAVNILRQFRHESETVFPAAQRAVERKQIFNLAQEVFDKIPEEEVSENDIDHINSLIDPLNKAIEKQNEEFSRSESKRKQLFDTWNTEIAAFFNKYLS